MTLSLAIDILVAVLLVATIGFAAVLNRRLGALRDDKEKLEKLVEGLTVAAQRAESGVAGLREAADDIGAHLQKKVDQGTSLRDDLAYMIDRGGALADRIEGTIRAKRDAPMEEPPRRREGPRPEAAVRGEGTLRSEPGLRLEPIAPSSRIHDDKTDLDGPRRTGSQPSRSEIELQRALSGRR